MRTLRLLSCSVCLSLLCVAGPANAAAVDEVQTAKYLEAGVSMMRSLAHAQPIGDRALVMLEQHVSGTCKGILAAAPEGQANREFQDEISAEVEATELSSGRGAIAHFAHVVASLHWNSLSVQRAVRTYSSNLAAFYAAPLPDLCSSAGEWAASDFASLSSNAKQLILLDHHVERPPNKVALALLKPYEPQSLRRTARLVDQLEREVARHLVRTGVPSTLRIIGLLGLSL
jgi:hypothetical protein